MTTAVNELKTSVNERTIVIGLYRENRAWTVRKSEIVHGMRVPIDQVENLNSSDALQLQTDWWKEYNYMPLN